jgi:hypothetical protein
MSPVGQQIVTVPIVHDLRLGTADSNGTRGDNNRHKQERVNQLQSELELILLPTYDRNARASLAKSGAKGQRINKHSFCFRLPG